MQDQISISKQSILTTFAAGVYGWLFIGLSVTAIIAFLIGSNTSLLFFFLNNSWILLISFFIQLGIVVTLSASLTRLNGFVATSMFLIYAAMNGIFLSSIFIAYSLNSLVIAFFTTAGTFGVMALYGTLTNQNLTRWGNFALMALFAVIIGGLVNIFLNSDTFTWFLTYVSLAIFIVLTAYDAQKIKQMALLAEERGDAQRFIVISALSLYLDFINLFLLILRILGRRN